jgi:hypothetical protein
MAGWVSGAVAGGQIAISALRGKYADTALIFWSRVEQRGDPDRQVPAGSP